jgi:hypothetical protein
MERIEGRVQGQSQGGCGNRFVATEPFGRSACFRWSILESRGQHVDIGPSNRCGENALVPWHEDDLGALD